MAEGRLIKKKISRDERVAQLTPNSQLLYAYSIPVLDNDGRMPGDPAAVRALAAPFLPWDDAYVETLIAAWARTTRIISGTLAEDPLVIRYPLSSPCRWRDKELGIECECRLALQFTGFAANQPLRVRRGARSSLPPPDPLAAGQLALMDTVAPMATVSQLATVSHLSIEGDGSSAHARGKGGFKSLVSALEVQDLAAAAAREGGTSESPEHPVTRLRGEFARLFGRTSAEPVGPRLDRLSAALLIVGHDRACVLLRERAAAGAPAKSVSYFLTPLEELAAALPAGGDTAGPATEACIECGLRRGLHVAGCSLATEVPAEVRETVARLSEIGAGDVGRQVPAA